MCRKSASTSQNYAKKKAALNPAKCVQKRQTPLAKQMKKNTLTYAHKAALNAEKQKDRSQKKMLMWHNNMTAPLVKRRKN
jgi:hypothetical protein